MVLGGRLFDLDDTATDPAEDALELCVAGVRSDPIEPDRTAVELAAWGDTGYGTWAEPILARVQADGEDLACTGLIETGQLLTPSAQFTMPDRVRAPH